MSAEHGMGGIVRAPRRPGGWRAPGPRPPEAFDPGLGPRAGEDLCYLVGDFRILQRIGGHRWSLDDLVTAQFAASFHDRQPPRRYADLGCGVGSVLMMLAWRFPGACGVGLEAQESSVALARRSLAINGLDGRCRVELGDLRISEDACGPFDLVTGTPPYLPVASARASDDAQRRACRIETRGGIEDYCRAAAARLAPDGRFVCCMPGTPDGRIGEAAQRAGLAVERQLDVVPRTGKPPLFAVWSLRRCESRVTFERLRPLVVRDARGAWTPAFLQVRCEMGMPGEPSASEH